MDRSLRGGTSSVTGLEHRQSRMVCAVRFVFFQSLTGRSNSSVPHLQLYMHSENTIVALLKLNDYIGQVLLKYPTLSQLQLYKIFRYNDTVGTLGFLRFPLL